jgi:hypothetical protein
VTRLIVEEDGGRRGFKVGDGVLTVGSGEGASLRLTSSDVAELHAELGVESGRVTLRPKPGVLPPKIRGIPVSGPVQLEHQVPVQIGSAKLTVEYADAPERPQPVVRKQRPGARGAVAARRRARDDDEGEAGGRARYRKRQKSGAWVSLAIFAGVVAALALFAVFVGPALMGDAEPIFEPGVRLNRARTKVAKGLHEEALAELDAIPDDIQLEAAFQKQIDDLREEIATNIEEIALADHNMRGNEWLQTQLKTFESQRLAGKAEAPKIRVFLKRCDEFEGRYPQHPDIGWVRRMRERYAGAVDLSAPPTFEDIEFEIETLTWADPRDFKQAFQILDAYIETAGGDDRANALKLYDKKLKHRDEWFEDKLQQARWEYEREDLAKSLAWLIRIILFTGDEVMAETAAQELIKFPDLVPRLRGYRRHSPEKYERLVQQPTVGRYVRDHPLDEEP